MIELQEVVRNKRKEISARLVNDTPITPINDVINTTGEILSPNSILPSSIIQ